MEAVNSIKDSRGNRVDLTHCCGGEVIESRLMHGCAVNGIMPPLEPREVVFSCAGCGSELVATEYPTHTIWSKPMCSDCVKVKTILLHDGAVLEERNPDEMWDGSHTDLDNEAFVQFQMQNNFLPVVYDKRANKFIDISALKE